MMPGTGCMKPMRNVLPEDFEITSVTTLGSMPKPSAIRNASLTATPHTPAIRLLQSLTTSPLPTGPTRMTLADLAAPPPPRRAGGDAVGAEVRERGLRLLEIGGGPTHHDGQRAVGGARRAARPPGRPGGDPPPRGRPAHPPGPGWG